MHLGRTWYCSLAHISISWIGVQLYQSLISSVDARMILDFQLTQELFLQSPTSSSVLNCNGHSLADILPAKSEPSDLAWDPLKQLLYIVSDNGHLVILGLSPTQSQQLPQMQLIDKIKVKHKPDLEGITLIPSRPGYVYLGVEEPAAILEFHISSQTIVSKLDLDKLMNDVQLGGLDDPQVQQKNQGLESLVYIPAVNPHEHPGFIIVGRQQDARLFVFNITSKWTADSNDESQDNLEMKFMGTTYAPGPSKDLSAITLWRSHIWLLYDKPKQMHSVQQTDFYNSLNLLDPAKVVSFESTAQTKTVEPFSFKTRGQEGIAFADNIRLETGQSGSNLVFIAVDAPHKTGQKDLLMFSLDSFFGCFSSQGISGIPLSTSA
ncbi:hypothetical protein QVD99_006694 [Batrachochytrium dendrobatidis]|nr:hypothetical protein O5D80_005326 [Batrachochytrium dendrobatidis]KAK5666628.1 hypothetical protein QVD99_006694 [Batrachochytrium dendrobatidis]